MRALVTGASGRIGRNLCRGLLDRGDLVRALVIPDDPNLGRLQAIGVECLVGRLEDYAVVAESVRGVDSIYHLGALLPQGVDSFRLFEANLRGTFHVLEAAAREGTAKSLHRFVFASTDATYPSGNQLYLPIDETHPQQPNYFYGLTKEAGERMCLAYGRQYGFPLVRPRFTFTIEAWEMLDPRTVAGPLFFLEARLRGLKASARQGQRESAEAVSILEPLVKPGTQQLLIAYGPDGTTDRMTLCDVRDVVQGLLLLDQPAAVGEAFNLGPPCGFSFDVAVKRMAELTGLPYVEAKLPLKPICFEVSSAKARATLGYQPRYQIFDMIESAVDAWSQQQVPS